MKKSSKGPTDGGMRSHGAFKFNEAAHSRSMPKEHYKVNNGSRMSGAHGTNGQSHNNNMDQHCGDRIGHGKRSFKHGIPGEAGPHSDANFGKGKGVAPIHKNLSKGGF